MDKVPVQDGDITSIKVRLVFQAGQAEMTMAQLQELAPGMIITSSDDVGPVIDIMANGVKIAEGELVQAGDQIAVRISWLSEND